MKLFIEYDFPNWNDYINIERRSMYAANTLKQKEKDIVRYYTIGQRYKGNYPIEIVFRPYFKDRRKDLDNFRIKSVLDGLVTCGVIKNDNLTCINKITLEPIFSEKEGVEIEIKEMNI